MIVLKFSKIGYKIKGLLSIIKRIRRKRTKREQENGRGMSSDALFRTSYALG